MSSETNSDSVKPGDDHKSAPDFLKNAAIRSGQVPGWPSKAGKTNGDPYDKNNVERCTAHMVVSEGMVARNAMSAHVAMYIAKRRVAVFALLGAAVVLGACKAYYPGPSAPIFSFGGEKASPAGGTKAGIEASQLIEKFYTKGDGAAGDVDVKFLSDPSLAVKMMGGEEVDYIVNWPRPYANDFKEPNKHFEAILAKFLNVFPSTANSYCDSQARMYAETTHASQIPAQVEALGASWKSGIFEEKKPGAWVESVRELRDHRIANDPECKNPNVMVMKIGKGALEYLVSMKGRVHVNGTNKVGTALYLLADVNGKKIVQKVACANCEGIKPMSDQPVNNSIVQNLNVSAEGIVSAFNKSGFNLQEGVK